MAGAPCIGNLCDDHNIYIVNLSKLITQSSGTGNQHSLTVGT